MISRRLALFVCAVAFVAIAQPATASAERNPYTAEQVCGALPQDRQAQALLRQPLHDPPGHHLPALQRSHRPELRCHDEAPLHRPAHHDRCLAQVKGKRRPWVVDQDAFSTTRARLSQAPGRCVRWARRQHAVWRRHLRQPVRTAAEQPLTAPRSRLVQHVLVQRRHEPGIVPVVDRYADYHRAWHIHRLTQHGRYLVRPFDAQP